MKKLVFIIISLLFLASCGPHRLSCGPGKRCVDNNINSTKVIS